METIGINHSLDKYLKEKNIPDIIIASKTNISTTTLSNMRNLVTDSLTAKQLYLISLAVEDTIEKTIDKVFPGLALIHQGTVNSNLTSLGQYLEDNEVSKNTKEIISAKTGIKKYRLTALATNDRYTIQAYELILIEMALEMKKGQIFSHLFRKEVTLNSKVEANKILEEIRSKNAKAHTRRKNKNEEKN